MFSRKHHGLHHHREQMGFALHDHREQTGYGLHMHRESIGSALEQHRRATSERLLPVYAHTVTFPENVPHHKKHRRM